VRRLTTLAMLAALSVPLLAQTPIPEREAAVRAVFARHIKDQARTLDCIAVIEPQRLAVAKQDWVDILESARKILERGGFSPESMAAVAAAQPDKLMISAEPEKMRASCVADKVWEDHWFRFMAYGLVGDVREIVEGRR